MEMNQIQIIKELIRNYFDMDLKNKLSTYYENEPDLNSINIGDYSVLEFFQNSEKLFKQLNVEIEENGKFLPHQYNYQNEFGNGTLQSDLQNYINHLNADNFSNSVVFLKRIIYYQIINGFWDKSKKKIHNVNEVKLTNLNKQLDIISEHIVKHSESYKKLFDEIELQKGNLKDFINQKNNELSEINNSLQTVRNESNEISSILNKSTSTEEKINSIYKQNNEYLEKIRLSQDEIDDYKNDLSLKIDTFDDQIKKFDTQLKFVENKKSFFEERNKYLEELIGREVGASLFETFKQRKGELNNPVNTWKWIVVGMSVLTFLGVLAIFTNFFGLYGEILTSFSWQIVVINALKSSPFFFLLYYSVSQYNKERNFQEEYAFKSAVALTIKAYVDLINDKKSKDTLILKSVLNIYQSPIYKKFHKDKEVSSLFDLSKNLLDTTKELVSSLKSVPK